MTGQPAKSWWKSKTIWGLLLAGASFLGPKSQWIAQHLPALIDQIGITAGLIYAAYGRITATQQLK